MAASSDTPSASVEERNKALVTHVIESYFNQGDFADLDALVASDFVLHSPTLPEPGHGREALRDFATGLRTGFPDFHMEIEDRLAEGNRVAVRWRTTQQTHLGPYQGIPPTGRAIEMTGIHIYRIEDGRLEEVWLEIDALRGLQQLGIVARSDVGPLGLIGWAFKTVGRLAVLQARHSRRARSA